MTFRNTIRTALAAGLAIALLGGPARAEAPVEITVNYSFAALFQGVHEANAKLFMEQHPHVKVRLLAPVALYEDVAQAVLRGAITKDLPDLSYQGLNQQRLITDRGLAIALDGHIAGDKEWAQGGRVESMLSAGRLGGKQYGLPFAVSTPIMYYNADLVRRAGGNPDAMPTTWPELIALANRISALNSGIIGLQYNWMITGNWMWQALVLGNNGRFMNEAETELLIERPEAAFAMRQLAEIVRKTKMPVMSRNEVRAAFVAGQIGMMFSSTSELGVVAKTVGNRFELRTGEFPTTAQGGTVPSGGNAVMVHSTDPAKQKAAWAYARFVTSADGQTQQVRLTGYMPTNSIPATKPEMLGTFYKENPNHLASVRQLPRMVGWYAWPGDNSLKIVEVIHKTLEALVTDPGADADALNTKMAGEIRSLLPNR